MCPDKFQKTKHWWTRTEHFTHQEGTSSRNKLWIRSRRFDRMKTCFRTWAAGLERAPKKHWALRCEPLQHVTFFVLLTYHSSCIDCAGSVWLCVNGWMDCKSLTVFKTRKKKYSLPFIVRSWSMHIFFLDGENKYLQLYIVPLTTCPWLPWFRTKQPAQELVLVTPLHLYIENSCCLLT